MLNTLRYTGMLNTLRYTLGNNPHPEVHPRE